MPALVRRARYKGPAQHLSGGWSWRSLTMAGSVRMYPHSSIHMPSCLVTLRSPAQAFRDGVGKYLYEIFSYLYFPPGCGRSRPERAKRQWCHQVCPRPLRRVEEASVMGLPDAPELQNVTAAQNVFLRSRLFGFVRAVSGPQISRPKIATGPPSCKSKE